MNFNLLDEESIQPSEPTAYDFFIGENADLKAKELGLPDLELVKQAIMIGDADYRTNTVYNRARFIGRWGKIIEQIALLLKKSDSAWVFHNESQPRIENTVKNIQIIFMAGNLALGHADQVLSASCEKGSMTLKNIKANQSTYDDESKLRTWIVYFPSASHPAYKESDLPTIPFEIAYPTSFVQTPTKSKISILPSNHSCRIAFEIDNTFPIKTDSKPVLEPSDEIKPDDFDIQLVV
ncbi:hypothetical protein E5F90_18470 [Acinetobacter baumannii]|uniref:hypothetical protein n=1 Tax=Acinetobacter TaxID=469 RepID=UPI0010A4EF17|nr:hypothetical protein [Acinetobacter baumannii]THD93165.1 hypothetical protein E5F90_18470 [Acinetobacter baumannii]HAV5921269.1 hypothetical protein [Acinetobacter baumannii]